MQVCMLLLLVTPEGAETSALFQLSQTLPV